MSKRKVVVRSITVHEGLFDAGGHPEWKDWFLIQLAPSDLAGWLTDPAFRALVAAIEQAHPHGPAELWKSPTFLLRRHGDVLPFPEGATIELSVSRTAWDSAPHLPERLHVDAWSPA